MPETSRPPGAPILSPWSVRTYLVWLVLACLLPGALGAAALFSYQYRNAQAQLAQNTLQTARALVQTLDGRLERALAVVQVLATSEALARDDLATFHRQAREVITLLGVGTNVVLRDRSGRQLVNSVVDIGRPLPAQLEPGQVAPVFATGEPRISDLFIGPVLRRPIMSIDVPVRRAGQVVYALGIGILPDHFNALLLAQGLPPEWVVGVFDRAGMSVARTRDAERFVGQPPGEVLSLAMQRAVEGTLDSVTREGTPVFTTFSRSPLTGWTIAIGIPRALLAERYIRPLVLLAVGLLMLFGVSLLLARVIAGRIARSVTALSAPTMALAGAPAVDLPPVEVKEVAQLAATIDRTAALLRERDAEIRSHERALVATQANALAAAGRAEAERRRLDAVLEATPVGIAVADATGTLLQVNAEHRRLWGLGAPATHGVDDYAQWHGWWSGGDHAGQPLMTHEWPMARALAGAPAVRDVIEIESFDDPPLRRIVLMSSAAIRDAAGTIVGGVLAQMDVTERVRAEQALHEADRRKDEFLAMLAHELRNPLAPISAAAELLGMGRLDADQIRQTSAVIARQVRHLTGLVEDLLDVSRVTRGLVRLQRVPIDLRTVVTEAVEQARPLLVGRQHMLDLRLPDTPVPVLGDVKRLVQVITNLLNNAAKFTPEGGRIAVALTVRGARACVVVTDNGIGMSPALLQSAFELFAQGERTPDRIQGGLGIGLALVRSLVEMHGGRVKASSGGAGRGSRFDVCLPLHEERRALARPAVPSQAVTSAPGPARRVLIVDDNVDAAQMLALLVRAQGHDVAVEHDPHAALERAAQFRPDACLLDIGLPGMDGRVLVARLRALPETADAVMVAITGYGQANERRSSLAAGFDQHLTKPVDAGQLAAILAGSGSADGGVANHV